MTRRRRMLAISSVLVLGTGLAACGSQDIEPQVRADAPNINRGAQLFAERCAGCHSMKVVGAEGGATRVHDRERVDGPDFDVRREDVDSVLFAIRNGGFSGAVMPENIVVGKDAQDVAAFLAKYAGGPRQGNDITPESQEASGGGGGETTATETTPSSTTGGETTPSATTGGETTPSATTGGETTPSTTTGGGGGAQANARGKQVFTENCAGCHTLGDANASGQIGPNLDQVQPDEQTVRQTVEAGRGVMPAFRGKLPDSDIQAVAAYVSSVAGE